MGKISFYLNPKNIIIILMNKGYFRFLSDKAYLKLKYRLIFKKKLDLEHPKTYNEKLQWLKIYDHNPNYVNLVDKYEVKKIIEEKIGKEYIISTYGVYNSFDEIDFAKLPNQFVIKSTNDSGGVVVCQNKETFNILNAKKKINKSLKKNYFYTNREWPYKNIQPRIIVEKYLEDTRDKELRDYKFFCFNGKVKFLFVASNRQGEGETYFDFFDNEYHHLDIINGHSNAPTMPHKPKNFDLMISLAEKLSQDINHVRVDFYEANGKIYFGEMTFYHWSGLVAFEPMEWDYKFGEMLNLPSKDNI